MVFVGGMGEIIPVTGLVDPPLVLLKTSLAGMLFIPCTAKMLRTSHPVVCDCEKSCKKIFACGELSSILLFSFVKNFVNYTRAIVTKAVKNFACGELSSMLLFNIVHNFINFMRAMVTKAVKIFRLRRAKLFMYIYMHCNVHTPRWGGIYTTTPVQLTNDTPLGSCTGKK